MATGLSNLFYDSGVYGAALGAFVLWRVLVNPRRVKPDVPVVGSRVLFGWVTAVKSILGSKQLLEEGYRKYKDRTFEFPGFFAPTYVVSSPELITEVRRASDKDLSFWTELVEAHGMRYTFTENMADDSWHFALLHRTLSSSHVDALFPDVIDEMRYAFDKVFAVPESGGKSIKFYDSILELVVRINNRMLVGLPLCRSDDYTKYSCTFLKRTATSAFYLSMLPERLRAPVVWLFGMRKPINEGGRYLAPVIDERRKAGQEEENPNDFLQAMIDNAPPNCQDAQELAVRLVSTNLASTHTTALPFTRVFYDLLAHPECLEPLREEAKSAIVDYGWTSEGIRAMVKLDSFFKESMRYRGIQLTSLNRHVMRPTLLSDGILLPAGASLVADAWGVHHDPELYPEPDTLDPWRFSRKIEQGDSVVHNAFWTSSTDYLVWGHGAHACAGRFFATSVLKAVMAYILLTYDFKLPDGEKEPKLDTCISVAALPPMKGKFDFLQWMMDAAEGDQAKPHDLNLRILGVNFAATHTSTMT
ncbi:cytochrome P450 [Dacryopinax primogenitus]|uniref:Cytochrome P450 n=1 Tax=Dacryopinax primogenitus (strain DJM 731) TaxID=1858805 RepID=M5FPP1_DACPD|nr:cytochrome P450 [Dacryopinax primogenitus]EJT96544.1 cytochrome P450 [Dacryopinax primogenitus]